MVGPRWHVRDRLEDIHDEIQLHWPMVNVFRVIQLSLPLFAGIGVSLTLPYLLAHYVGPWLSKFPKRRLYHTISLLVGNGNVRFIHLPPSYLLS